MAYGAQVDRVARYGEALTGPAGAGEKVLGGIRRRLVAFRNGPLASVLLTQHSSQLLRPLWRSLNSGIPVTAAKLQVGRGSSGKTWRPQYALGTCAVHRQLPGR